MIKYINFLYLYLLLLACNNGESKIVISNDYNLKINTYENSQLSFTTLYKNSLPIYLFGFSETDTINPETIAAYFYKDKQLDSISIIKGEKELEEFWVNYEKDTKFMILELNKEDIDIQSYNTDPIGQELYVISTIFGIEEYNLSRSNRITDTAIFNKRLIEISFDSLNISPFIAKMNLFSENNILTKFRLETVDNKVVFFEIILSDQIITSRIFYKVNHEVNYSVRLIKDKNDSILEKTTRQFEYFYTQNDY